MVSLSLLCKKDIISLTDGRNIGRRDDVEFDEKTALVENIVVFGRPKLFGLMGRGKDIKIPWSRVITIGRDVVLVNLPQTGKTGNVGRINVDYD